MLEDLWKERGEKVRVRKLAKIAGVIGSFTLAMGNVARFYTRGMLTQVVVLIGRARWESCGQLKMRVLEEIEFWRKNLRSLNCWRMHDSEEVVYFKEGCVDMFSDASDFQLAGARFEGEQVCWDTRFKVSLSEKEKGASSTFRELRAIEEGLRAHGSSLRGKTVRWGCDNWLAGKIVKWGSMKRDCHQVATEIEKLCRRFEIRLETFWIPRESRQIEPVMLGVKR